MRISPRTALWCLLAVATCLAAAAASMAVGEGGAIIALLPAAFVIGRQRRAEELRGQADAPQA
jgi:hypothetical protein